jgi:serine/threonine-protein phosphatase 6 regulatory subunit 3
LLSLSFLPVLPTPLFPLQDGFGPFSDPSGGTVNDTFTFSSSFSDEDSSFDSFGEFGDFQTAEDHDHDHDHDGSLTPTSGSWTFANEVGGSVDSISSGSSSGGGGGGGRSAEGGSVDARGGSSSRSR